MKNIDDSRLTTAYHHAMSSDYKRRRKISHMRLAIDICIFFFLGVLLMILAELAIAEEPCGFECFVRQHSMQKEPQKQRSGVWIERPQQHNIVIDQTIRHREDSLVDRMFPPAAPTPYRQQYYITRENH